MGTLLVVGLLLWVMLAPNKPLPRVNKKKLHAERIKEAHRIMLNKANTLNQGRLYGTINQSSNSIRKLDPQP